MAPCRSLRLYGETGRSSPAFSWNTVPLVMVKVDSACCQVASGVRSVECHFRTAFVIPTAGLVRVPVITHDTMGESSWCLSQVPRSRRRRR